MAKQRILIISKSSFCIDLVRDFLKHSEVVVDHIEAAAQAAALIERTVPGLVVFDCDGNSDPAATIAALRGEAKAPQIPFIAFNAPERSRGMDPTEYLPKPLNRAIFLDLAHSFMEKVDRREPRILCRAMVSIRQNGTTFYGTIEDISSRGMYIGTPFPVENNSLVSLRFVLPWEEARMIETQARVAWKMGPQQLRRSPLPIGFGVEFTGFSDASREEIERYIDFTTGRKTRIDS